MIRGKIKWFVHRLLLGGIAIMTLIMALIMAPGTAPEMANPEFRVAPFWGEDWPVLENPDQDDTMVAGRRARHANPPA